MEARRLSAAWTCFAHFAHHWKVCFAQHHWERGRRETVSAGEGAAGGKKTWGTKFLEIQLIKLFLIDIYYINEIILKFIISEALAFR